MPKTKGKLYMSQRYKLNTKHFRNELSHRLLNNVIFTFFIVFLKLKNKLIFQVKKIEKNLGIHHNLNE
jgi:hypothetical protein